MSKAWLGLRLRLLGAMLLVAMPPVPRAHAQGTPQPVPSAPTEAAPALPPSAPAPAAVSPEPGSAGAPAPEVAPAAELAPAPAQPAPTPTLPTPAPAAASTSEPATAAAPSTELEAPYPRFLPSVRVITGVQYDKTHPTAVQVEDDSRQPFFLDQARVELEVEGNEWLSAELSAELSDDPAVRDAFANVKIKRLFQVRAGHFKRPLSRIELTSLGKLPFRKRGLFNDSLVRGADFGGRALGLMLWGRTKSRGLRWHAAVTNSARSAGVPGPEEIRGADLLGRVELEPVRELEVALNGGRKWTEPYVDGPNLGLWVFGGDVRVRLGELRVIVESLAAENPRPPAPPSPAGRTPLAANVLGYATYDFSLTPELALQPVAGAEWSDTDTDLSQDEALRIVAGVNLLGWDSALRVMPQLELVRPLGTVSTRSQLEREAFYLVLSAEL